MESTYKNLLNLSKLFETQGRDINVVTLQYRKSQDPIQFAYIFCKLYPFMVTQTDKYFYLTDQDKASHCIEELSKAISNFKLQENGSIQTLFGVYLNNRLRAETQQLQYNKRKANNAASDYESLTYAYDDRQFESVDLLETLKSMDLSDNELRYCQLIIRDADKIKDTDIAKLLGISSAAITYIKNRLQKKLQFAV
jgi:hypothetical protein